MVRPPPAKAASPRNWRGGSASSTSIPARCIAPSPGSFSNAVFLLPTTAAIEQLAEHAPITCQLRGLDSVILIDGVDPEPFLRDDRVNDNVSLVSSVPRVREILVDHLRRSAPANDLVMEGRDIGSVVFPETPYKFYIDASPDIRRAAATPRDSAIASPRAIKPIPRAAPLRSSSRKTPMSSTAPTSRLMASSARSLAA